MTLIISAATKPEIEPAATKQYVWSVVSSKDVITSTAADLIGTFTADPEILISLT